MMNTTCYDKVLAYAYEKHNGQCRRDGSKYIKHPVWVANILIQKHFDDTCILAGLLHDVIEDCNVTEEDIFNYLKQSMLENKARFISKVVVCVSKDKEDKPEQTIEKILNCKDEEVRRSSIGLKLCDVLANTLETVELEDIQFKVRWFKKAKRYLNVFETVRELEFKNGMKASALIIEINNALEELQRSIPKSEIGKTASGLEINDVASNIGKEYINKDVKEKGIA